MSRAAVALALVLAVALTACSDDSRVPEKALPKGPFSACPAATADTPPAGLELSGLSLRCFASGESIALAGLGRPLIINLWASWCEPCRTELPHFQTYADRAGSRVLVLGVVTKDDPEAAVSLAEDLKLTFPAVFDGSGALLAQLGRNALPITLFVDSAGRVQHRYEGTALTEDGLTELANRYLGVVVP